MALAGKSPLKTVIPVEVTKEFAHSSHKLKGLTGGNVSPCFDLRMVRQRNTCMPGKKKELVGVLGVLRRRKRVAGVESRSGMLVVSF